VLWAQGIKHAIYTTHHKAGKQFLECLRIVFKGANCEAAATAAERGQFLFAQPAVGTHACVHAYAFILVLAMSFLESFRALKQPKVRWAWVVAVVADAMQIAALPLFAEGALSPADSVLDVVVGIILVRLLGWHWAFLPTLAAELIPGLDLFPTWTAAVWFVTRQKAEETSPAWRSESTDGGNWSNPPEPEILPPDPKLRRE